MRLEESRFAGQLGFGVGFSLSIVLFAVILATMFVITGRAKLQWTLAWVFLIPVTLGLVGGLLQRWLK